MRRSVFCLLTVGALLTCTLFSGCAASSAGKKEKLSIVTTSFPPFDFARAVVGEEEADINMLLCPGAEAHSYEPAPLDILKIQECDVFVYIGGEGEVWVDEILESVGNPDMTVIRLMDYIDPLEEAEIEGASPDGHEHEHEHEHHHHDDEDCEDCEYDEHIWTSVRNAALCVEGIENALSQAYPDSEELFSENVEKYCGELYKLDAEFSEMTENAPTNLIVIGDRFPFRYLAEDYGLQYSAAFSGCSSESEPGVYTMAFLIDKVISNNTDTVFYLEFSTKKLAEKLCDATGAQMLPLHSCHNVTKEEFEEEKTYIDLMRQNLNNLREALY